MFALVHPVLADRRTGIGGVHLEGGGSGGGGRNHHGVLHGAGPLEGVHHFGDGRLLLADGDVDALHAQALLIDDRIDGHGSLAGLAVTDDQLALSPTDRDHAVDGFDSGLERFGDRLALHD